MCSSSTIASISTTGCGHDKDESIGTTDVEFSHHLKVFGRHDLVWGAGFRQVRDTVLPAFDSSFTPVSYTARTYNGFVQDEIALRRDSIRLTAGTKFERNAFSGIEIQPTVRLLWAPAQTHSAWTAVSRAVRVPSRSERDQDELESIGENETATWNTNGSWRRRCSGPSELTSYEAGYRFVPATRLSLDVASFYNVYDDLQTIETQDAFLTAAPIAGVMTPLVRANLARGRVAGAEVTAFWTVSDSCSSAATTRGFTCGCTQIRTATTRTPRRSRTRMPRISSMSAPTPTFRTGWT